jgi:general secretion pathway protein I
MKAMSMLNRERLPAMLTAAGFTLLEVMIAIAILAVTLTVLYGSQTQSLSLATEAKFNTTAALLSTLKLAELESGLLELSDDEGEVEGYPDFHWQVEVEEAELEDFEALQGMESVVQQVRLTISWSDSPFVSTVTAYIRERP